MREPIEAARPMCAVHPERSAQRTCSRCGRFSCGECAGDRSVCVQCFEQALRELPSSSGRAKWSVGFLISGAIVDGVSCLVSVSQLALPGENVVRDILEGLCGLGILVSYIGAVITFLRWQHLAVRQANLMGHEIGFTPGWAVGWWFVPFANLVKPFHAMRGLLSALGGEGAVAEARLTPWWTAWILSSVLSQLESRLALKDGLDTAPSAATDVVGILASLAGIAAALFCAGVVRTVQRHLDQRSGAAPSTWGPRL